MGDALIETAAGQEFLKEALRINETSEILTGIKVICNFIFLGKSFLELHD